jgi:orotidine-5'-phosphate decarboxylase
MKMATELVVALDYSDQKKADSLMEQLEGLPIIYKIGLELFLSADSAWIQALCSSGTRVFLDLKFHDIPNTVASAMLKAANLGAEFVTIHLSGGRRMLDEIDIRLQEAILTGEVRVRPKILGVSVLTSFKEEEWIANVSHMAKVTSVRSIEDTAMHFANLVHEHPAVQGMVCSPQEVEKIRMKYPNLYLMVPGIRLEGGASHDQNRVMTPAEARSAGASAVVVGRPITQATDPRAIAQKILRDIT